MPNDRPQPDGPPPTPEPEPQPQAEPQPPPRDPEPSPPANPAPPVTLSITLGPAPAVTVTVQAWGDEPVDRSWVEYGYALVEGFLGRHKEYRDHARDVGAAQLNALRRAAAPPTEPARPAAAAQRPAQPQQQRPRPSAPPRGGNRPSGRPAQPAARSKGTDRSRFEYIEGYTCPECGGDCGVKPRTGRMRYDSVVCLGDCEDANGYPLEVETLR